MAAPAEPSARAADGFYSPRDLTYIQPHKRQIGRAHV